MFEFWFFYGKKPMESISKHILISLDHANIYPPQKKYELYRWISLSSHGTVALRIAYE